jgi:hypothetical protein
MAAAKNKEIVRRARDGAVDERGAAYWLERRGPR